MTRGRSDDDRAAPVPEPPAGRQILDRLNWYANQVAAASPGGIDHGTLSVVAALLVVADALTDGQTGSASRGPLRLFLAPPASPAGRVPADREP